MDSYTPNHDTLSKLTREELLERFSKVHQQAESHRNQIVQLESNMAELSTVLLRYHEEFMADLSRGER